MGISIEKERIAVSVANHAESPPKIVETVLLDMEESLDATLKKAIKKLSSSGCQAVVGLSMFDSKFHKIQKPNVPDEELDASLPFLMKDRLSQSVEKSLVACVKYPEGCRHDDQLMVIEVTKARVTEIVDSLHDIGVEIAAIDVAELVIGDLFATQEDMAKGVAILAEHDTGVNLLLYRNHSLYLIRGIQDVPDLISCLPAPGNVQMADTLMLEVQRTLDYYDSLMGQPMPARLYLVPSFADLSPLAEHLDANLAPSVSVLDLNELYSLPDVMDYGTQHDVLVAVAASMRRQHR